jgi:hypothetical protein
MVQFFCLHQYLKYKGVHGRPNKLLKYIVAIYACCFKLLFTVVIMYDASDETLVFAFVKELTKIQRNENTYV